MLALDTDVLVAWSMAGAPHHRPTRVLVEGELARRQGKVMLAPRVVEEFLHVATDKRRFETPFTMARAIEYAGTLVRARDVVCMEPPRSVLLRTLELLEQHRLGRRHILEAALAATLEAAGVRRLATFNATDFACFEFIETVDPRA
jgi:predicted nucleic acid-binding protein